MKRQQKNGCGCALLILLSLLVLSAAWLYTAWRSSQAVLPPGLAINDMPVGGMTRGQALLAIEQAYTVPVTVTYAGEVLAPLLPEMIELRVDVPATAENLDDALSGEIGAVAFVRYIADRVMGRAHEVITVNAVVLYSRERVNTFLERTAQKYDHEPLRPVALPEAGTFRPAMEGTTLDKAASLPPLIDAILAADRAKRQVALVVETEPAPEASIDILTQALRTTLAGLDPGAVAGLFAKDLSTGQEFCLNCDIAFTGTSAAKLGIAVAASRDQPETTSADDAALIARCLAPGEDALTAADALLAQLGTGDAISGTREVTSLFLGLGLESSYLTTPLAAEAGTTAGSTTATSVPTPANTATGPSADPDAGIQTTPMEAGLLLESLYYCADNGGVLRMLYPHAVTPAKCQALLATMTRHRAYSYLARDLPLGVTVAQQQAGQATTFSEVALFYGPRTDLILAVFLYDPAWSDPEASAPFFAQTGHLTYRFFNGDHATP